MKAVSAPSGVHLDFPIALASLIIFTLSSLAYVGYQDKQRDHDVPDTQRYKLVYTVLPSHLDVTKDAIFEAGGGTYAGGKYKKVAYEITGRGQFIPVAGAGAVPHTGMPGKLEKTEEIRVEILCIGSKVTKASVQALKRTHPYEVCAYEVYRVEDF